MQFKLNFYDEKAKNMVSRHEEKEFYRVPSLMDFNYWMNRKKQDMFSPDLKLLHILGTNSQGQV